MNGPTLEKITAEIAASAGGTKLGRIFPLSRFETVIDLRMPDSRYLFISIEPAAPRIYLIKRRLRDLERQTGNPSPFVLLLKKHLSGFSLQEVEKLPGERVLRFVFSGSDELGEERTYSFVVQLTGRSSNLFLLDQNDTIIDSARENSGQGQEPGNKYLPPPRENRGETDETLFPRGDFKTLSGSLDAYYLEKSEEKRFQAAAASARNKLKQELSRRARLLERLHGDLEHHGDPEKWKRFGDLLLANTGTARRDGDKIIVTDFYDENMPEVAIEAADNLTVTEAAEAFFKRYAKARNARVEVSKRLEEVENEIKRLKSKQEQLEAAIEARDEDALAEFAGIKQAPVTRDKKKQPSFSGARRFLSSDGFEILVGKGAKDNDFLTFRVAKSLDLWMHAADYPGSHVVVKNPSRREIPQKTLLEAAQLAAFYSSAREQPKAAVHYTQKKFVNKPKGSNAGLVSLSSFKTILVEPKIENVSMQ